jgi:hypothetical protein
MKNCILCNKKTQGSAGAAGIKWSFICQPCKDKEDRAYEDSLNALSKTYKAVIKENER